MKYILLLLSCLLIFPGCRKNKASTAPRLQVAVLRGPSAIAFAGWMKHPPEIAGRRVVIEIVDSPELIQAKIIKEEADLAVLPMIGAANLYAKDSPYKLAGCPIWGTLYLAGRDSVRFVHLFGAGTTPDILARHYLEKAGRHYRLNYAFPTAREILQGIRAGKVNAAVLSEPFLSIALREDSTFQVLADLNRPDDSSQGFAQTAILYLPWLQPYRQTLDSLLAETCGEANRNPQQTIRTLEEKEVFAPGMLTAASIERCRIAYRTAEEAENNIRSFLEIIARYEPKAIGGRLPDSGFITP